MGYLRKSSRMLSIVVRVCSGLVVELVLVFEFVVVGLLVFVVVVLVFVGLSSLIPS